MLDIMWRIYIMRSWWWRLVDWWSGLVAALAWMVVLLAHHAPDVPTFIAFKRVQPSAEIGAGVYSVELARKPDALLIRALVEFCAVERIYRDGHVHQINHVTFG